MTVYRVPLRKVFSKRKGRVKGDTTWDDIYSKPKCFKCRQHFKEGEPYRVVIEWRGTTKTVPVHRYTHVECQEPVAKKKPTMKKKPMAKKQSRRKVSPKI